MKVVEAPKSIEPWRIVCASQSEPDYSEERYILIYANDDPHEYCAGEGYILIEGGHCSCYSWTEVSWSAVQYTTDELKKLGKSKLDGGCYYEAEKRFWVSVLHAIGMW